MAKNSNLTAEKVNDATNEMLVTNKSEVNGITWGQAFDFAEAQDTKSMKPLTGAQWLKLDDFGTFVFAFMGMDTAKTDEGDVKVVKLTDREGTEWISSLSVLVSTCEKLTQIPTFLKIEYLDDKKGANGKYKNLKIYSL